MYHSSCAIRAAAFQLDNGRDLLLRVSCACQHAKIRVHAQVTFAGTLYVTDKHACFGAAGNSPARFSIACKDISEAVKVVDRRRASGECCSLCFYCTVTGLQDSSLVPS